MRKIWVAMVLIVTPLYGEVRPQEVRAQAKVKEIKIEKIDGNVKVVIFTDAEEYKDFTLQDSERVVIDIINSVSYLPSKISSPYLPLVRIRTSQYKRDPVPITRIVLDLEHKTPYSISPTEKGIEINLGEVEEPVAKIKEQKANIKEQRVKKVSDTLKEEETIEVKDTVEAKDTVKVALPESPESFFYNPRGKRDPFKPYLGIPSKDTLLDVSSATIVGIMWSPEERYALAEDASGKGFILMEGDVVSGGKVLKIEKEEVTFLVKVFGGTKRVVLKIAPRKEKKE